MPFRLGFKSILLLLTTLTLCNLLFVDILTSWGLSQPISLSICTTLGIAISMTIIMTFTKQIAKEKKKTIVSYFLFFLGLGVVTSLLIIF